MFRALGRGFLRSAIASIVLAAASAGRSADGGGDCALQESEALPIDGVNRGGSAVITFDVQNTGNIALEIVSFEVAMAKPTFVSLYYRVRFRPHAHEPRRSDLQNCYLHFHHSH